MGQGMVVMERGYRHWEQKAVFEKAVDEYSFWALFAVEDGAFSFKIASHEGQAGAGDVVCCPPHRAFHRQVIHTLTFHYILFSIEGQAFSSSNIKIPSGKIPIYDQNRLFSTLTYLRRIGNNVDTDSVYWKNHMVNDLIFQCQLPFVQVHVPLASRTNDALMEACAQTILTNYRQSSLRLIAESHGLSPVQFTRRFKKAFGQTPMEYLTAIRIQKAKTMLLESTDTLDQIAHACGYENGFYLSRIFMNKMHVRPSTYRKMHRV